MEMVDANLQELITRIKIVRDSCKKNAMEHKLLIDSETHPYFKGIATGQWTSDETTAEHLTWILESFTGKETS